MIHSARHIVTPAANIVFSCFVFLDLKTCAKTIIPTGRDCGLAEWIIDDSLYLFLLYKTLPRLTQNVGGRFYNTFLRSTSFN